MSKISWYWRVLTVWFLVLAIGLFGKGLYPHALLAFVCFVMSLYILGNEEK